MRTNAIRLLLPRDPIQFDELPNDVRGLLVWICTDVCEENCIESLEVLMYPGPTGLEIILHPRPTYLDGRRDTQTKITDFTDKLYTQAVSKLKSAIKRRTPETVTAEIGHVDLSTLGISDVTTSRLYGLENAQQLHNGISTDEPLEVLFKSFRENHDPFVYQVIVQEDNSKLNIVVRLALYHPRDNYVGDRGFAKLATQGKPNDPARAFRKHNVVSNHEGMAQRYHKIRYQKRIDGNDAYEVRYNYDWANQYNPRSAIRQKADKIKTIVLGKKEHRRLLNGDTTGDLICKEEFNRYHRLNVFPSKLEQFVRIVDQRWETNPWLAIDGRSAPTFTPTETIEITGGTDTKTTDITDATAPTIANEGQTGHMKLDEFARTSFTEGGDTITKVEQTSETVPDNRIRTDDGNIQTLGIEVSSDVVAVETESKNVTKGSNTLKNAERAHAAGREVVFVYEQTNVETGYNHLSETHKPKHDDGVILYNSTDPLETLDGRTLVCRNMKQVKYVLRGTEITAFADDRELASGDANEDLRSLEWDCHCFRKVDGNYRVETFDGELIEEYASKSAFLADWTIVRQPHIPLEPSYLHFATVAYRDSETAQLRLWDPAPSWETADKSETWKAGVQTFIDQYVVEREGGPELTYDELDETFSKWFEGHSQYPAPPRSVIGGYLPDELKDAKTGASGNEYKYFKGYGWRISPSIESPHRQGPPADYDPKDDEGDAQTETDSSEAADRDASANSESP